MLQLTKNDKEYLNFNSEYEFKKWVDKFFYNNTWDEDPQEYDDAEIINPTETNFFVSNEGDIYNLKEVEEEIDEIAEIMSNIKGFKPSNGVSWYYNNNFMSIRVSDHPQFYPSKNNNSFSIVVGEDGVTIDNLEEKVLELL